MIDKQYNDIIDFLEDNSFKEWVYNDSLIHVQFWDKWLEKNPKKKHLALEARDMLLGIKFNKNEVNPAFIDHKWEQFKDTVTKKQKLENSPFSRLKRMRFLGVAASVVLLISAGFFYLNSPEKISYKTSFGETLKFNLPDNSTVILNSNSSLSYLENNTRDVNLEGEAYFIVAKDKETHAKFNVNTADLKVEVYGTIFNVNTNNEKTQVFLKEGNIKLDLGNGGIKQMNPGNFVSYSSKENKILANKTSINPEEETSWRNGTLTFDNSLLEHALEKVTNTYNKRVVFKDEASKKLTITGSVPTTNLNICLEAIKKSVNVNIILKKDTIFIGKLN